MPLVRIFSLFSFLSTSPSVSDASPIPPNEPPTLRVCFPLKIQRGRNIWWEYEEHRIQFRDRLMWRQAFGLDVESLQDRKSRSDRVDDQIELNQNEPARVWREGVVSHDVELRPGDVALESRWSYSSSILPAVCASRRGKFRENIISETSPSRSPKLISRLLMTINPSQPNNTFQSPREVSSHYVSQPISPLEQSHLLRPSTPNLPPGQLQLQSPNSAIRHDTEEEERQHHRDIALRKLEGRPLGKTRERCLSAFRSVFRTQRRSAARLALTPLPQPVQKYPPQGQETICLPWQEWVKLRDIILSGLTGDAGGEIPPFTEKQEAMFMPAEQRGHSYKVQTRHQREAADEDDVMAALERIEAGNWEDVLFVTYEDTPREIGWWHTTRQPQVLQWGLNMI
ncbi:hypothetical protein V8C37DRAFT_90685 [Trichoderma ceciliae]